MFQENIIRVAVSIAQAEDYGLGKTAEAAGLRQGSVPELAGSVVGTALSLIGVLFFILMIYGGILWMTARGNEQQTEKAKTTITSAIIGIIIVLSAYAITNFVFQSFTRGSVGQGTLESQSGGGICCVYRDDRISQDVPRVVADDAACNALCEGGGPGEPGSCTPNPSISVNDCY